jgi:GNAT superfamily N-acetyltransferase
VSAVDIRPLRREDIPSADLVAYEALWQSVPQQGESSEARAARGQSRVAHLLETDPGGAWVAADERRVVGVALALAREGLWGLSLLAVEPPRQGDGIGRRLLDMALGYADGARGAIILSSTDPRAMRRYARAGFELRPAVAAAGIVERDALPAPDGAIREATAGDVALTEAASRAVRGATHAPDILHALAQGGGRLLVHGDRGFVVHVDGSPRLLAACDEDAARALLWASLAASPPGTTVQVDFMTAGQDWAVAICLEAGLALSPDGPVFVRGEVGPLRPYLPSGAYL